MNGSINCGLDNSDDDEDERPPILEDLFKPYNE